MEDLAPPLILILYIKRSMESGKSVNEGLRNYLHEVKDEFSPVVLQWFGAVEKESDYEELLMGIKSQYRKALLRLLFRGLKRESIYNALLNLEQETIQACQLEIDEKLTKLPYVLMIPVLFFQFPALLLLILGPLIQNFIESLK